jgi:beta-1,4-mannosyl-glycoprotein beta-1,4-N-acetylglucosaminyltransferase
MKIYDCILFNDELELLELRLNYLDKLVHQFIIVESEYTFSGLKKQAHFKKNESRFSKFAAKILYINDSKEPNKDNAWTNEFYQRNLLKTGLKNTKDNDIIIISDVDEIPYLSQIIKDFDMSVPQIIPMSLSYYFFNCFQDNAISDRTVITPYKFIKNIDVGNRDNLISNLNIDQNYKGIYGGHFSYLFGNNIDRYISKIKSFSHQEYNNDYYLNRERIQYCINNNIDIYERYTHSYTLTTSLIDKELLRGIKSLKQDSFLQKRRNLIRLIFHPKEMLFASKNLLLSSIYLNKRKYKILQVVVSKTIDLKRALKK